MAIHLSFEHRFYRLVEAMHIQLDVHARELFQLYLSELNKPTGDLISQYTPLYRPVFNLSNGIIIPSLSITEQSQFVNEGNLVPQSRADLDQFAPFGSSSLMHTFAMNHHQDS